MLCLACGTMQPPEVAECKNCEAYLGVLSVGQGFLPQLSILQEMLQENRLTPEQAEERLLRLDDHLGRLIRQMVQLKSQLPLVVKEIPEATIGRIITPVIEGLTHFRSAAADLSLEGDWSEEDWMNLKRAHVEWQNANLGLAALTQSVERKMGANQAT